ncbi:MAG: SGNH/GDSL hydrolase family protein [Treponema sp.]|jgi:lysophospholipase L1-like esterase|nr:SGNH/GDSL hydrolase family protein [Treponema sp.]
MKKIFTKGTIILFQGDSVTDCHRVREDENSLGEGYPAKIAGLWEALFPESGVRFINRGISGNRTGDLLDRYRNDFAALKPDLISILIGINDTWRRYDRNDPTTTEKFEQNYRRLLENLKRDLPSASIVLMEPFLLDTDPAKRLWREDLDPKIQAVRNLAREFAGVFIPLDGILASYAVAGIKDPELSADGVHPSPQGHGVIAGEWLKALGVL